MVQILRRSIELGLLEEEGASTTLIYFDTGRNFKTKDLQDVIINNQPSLILGPLLRENLIKINPIIDDFEIPLISFTNDKSLSKKMFGLQVLLLKIKWSNSLII